METIIQNKQVKSKERNSGIELLKILAIALIIIHHTVQTLRDENIFISFSDYRVDLSVASRSISNFILMFFSHFGALGNTIFFVCSCWFLLKSSKYNKKKWFFMLIEVWVVSVMILVCTLVARNGDIPGKMIIKCFFPTTFQNNWYITCYLLFYPIHPLLNSVIQKLDKKHLFRLSGAMFVIYCGFAFIKNDWYFATCFMHWLTVYFLIAYMQLYLDRFSESVKQNVGMLVLGLVGCIGLQAVTNVLGLHIGFFSNKTMHWISNYNPFLLAITIAAFNLMRRLSFKNKVINYFSGLTLLVYLIHENLLLRTFYRPAMWNYVYQTYGYDHLLVWVFAIAFVVLMFGLLCSIAYDISIRRFVRKISDRMYEDLCAVYVKLETALLRFR